jgi:hypothetical protein
MTVAALMLQLLLPSALPNASRGWLPGMFE